MSHFEDVFTWNYWEPLYPGDVVRDQPLRLAHWVATHPYRDYQAGEVSEFVEAYHSGLVFTKADIERLVRSNQRMWQAEDEEWRNSDFLVNRAAVPEWEPSDPAQHGHPRSAGTLWASLTEFDQTLAALGDGDAGNPNIVRQHAEAVAEFDWPVPSVRYLNLGCVLPSSVVAGELAYLVSKARASGHLRIVLTDAAGTDEIGRSSQGCGGRHRRDRRANHPRVDSGCSTGFVSDPLDLPCEGRSGTSGLLDHGEMTTGDYLR